MGGWAGISYSPLSPNRRVNTRLDDHLPIQERKDREFEELLRRAAGNPDDLPPEGIDPISRVNPAEDSE
jgi:hypothetical protein